MQPLVDRLERFYGPLPQPPDEPFALYVWEVLNVHTTPARRDAAMNALRRIPALTPDSMGKIGRGRLEKAITLAGPYREERLRALMAGVDVFRRNRDLPRALRLEVAKATDALKVLPHLTSVSEQWMLLFAGGHPMLPADPQLLRVISRLGTDRGTAAKSFEGVLPALQRAAMYLAHHGGATCVEAEPLCHICPLRSECPFPRGAAA
jgi:endonuclease III